MFFCEVNFNDRCPTSESYIVENKFGTFGLLSPGTSATVMYPL